jgi:hypothetical protein
MLFTIRQRKQDKEHRRSEWQQLLKVIGNASGFRSHHDAHPCRIGK